MSLHKSSHLGLCSFSPTKAFVSGVLGFLILINMDVAAQGNLLITPRRVVFEGSKRSFDLNLANIGKDSATYSISLIQMRMKENGGFEKITEPDSGQMFADRFIRYFPRTVTLGPNESQVVKVQLTRTSELKPGEYRSHFYFRSVPKAKPLGEKEENIDTTSISIKLTPIFGITIPAIIRNGTLTMKISMTDLAFDMVSDTIPNLSLVFKRSGNMSSYGDLAVDYVSTQGAKTRVGIANGVAVYTPNTIRHFQLNLNKKAGIDYTTGKLQVSYSSSSDARPEKFAEAELILNK